MIRITEKQYEAVARKVLPTYRRPNQRKWERLNKDSHIWEACHWFRVVNAIREAVESELGIKDQPESFYQKYFYGPLSYDAQVGTRGALLKRLITEGTD